MSDRNLYKLHASICQTLANPKRLEIIDKLRVGELSVTELVEALEISQSNLSQHLSVMRQRGIVTIRREGTHVRMFLMGDGVPCAVAKQSTPNGYSNVAQMLKSILTRGEVAT